ncbi:MAG: (Fe-S)-binding protein [Actinomycetota bacterium]
MTQPEPMSIFDADQLAACVQCGFCLSSCPTYETTHLEEHGPRGRILAMRLVQEGELAIDDPDVVDSLETCVQCRACEVVCPSLVEFGSLMETARAAISEQQPPSGVQGRAQEVLFTGLRHRWLLRLGTILLAVAQTLRLDRVLPSRLRPARRVRLGDTLRGYRLPPPGAAVQGDVYLFRGCVMDGMFRDVHRATAQVLAAVGYRPRFEPAPACCGALSAHGGREDEAHAMAEATIAAYAGTTGPILVNSAGCGGAMKEYGKLLGTPEAEAFSARVKDLSELISPEEVASRGKEVDLTLAYQAPCHLKNVQGLADQSRALVAAIPGLTLLEPDDEQQCCGSGGIYSYVQPEFGDALLASKHASLQRTGAAGVVSGNPGCAMQIAREGWEVHHPAQLLARALTP